jgi:3-(3-hydroxy-phenyl)propionate hydroxylase
MTPKTRVARVLRDAVLSLADEVPAGRALVNSGRLSVPTVLADSPLNTPDGDAFKGWMVPGAPLDDAALHDAGGHDTWLLPHTGHGFVLMRFGLPDAIEPRIDAGAAWRASAVAAAPMSAPRRATPDPTRPGCQALRARPGTTYLIRPDQHAAARATSICAVRAALARSTRQCCHEAPEHRAEPPRPASASARPTPGDDFYADPGPPWPERRPERTAQCAAGAAAGQPRRRPRRVARGAGAARGVAGESTPP